MLTVPKLPISSQRKDNHAQPALSYPFSGSSKYFHLDYTPDDFYIKSKIPLPIHTRGKENLSFKKYQEFDLTLTPRYIPPNSKNKYDACKPSSELDFLPLKNKESNKKYSPLRSQRTKISNQDSLNSTQISSFSKNQLMLQSLKQENEKYKKLIQQNQFLTKPIITDLYLQSKFLTARQNYGNDKQKTKIFSEPLVITTPKKGLNEMGKLTGSVYIDENLSCTNFGINGEKHNSQKEQKFNKFDFETIKFLGKGNFGEVNLVRHKRTNFICAMKAIKKSFVKNENVIHQIGREIRIHMTLKHLNIISFYGFFDDQQNVYFLMEYATGGQLFKRLKDCYRMPEKDVVPIIKDTLDGLRMIHSLRYIHRDLKPENIIFQFGVAKICDMGWAANCSEGQLRTSFCGTPLYLPPEMIKKEKYDQSADIWSVGILTYELLVGKIPFNIWSSYDLQQIVDRQITFPTNYVDMSEDSIDFIRQCLNRDHKKRIKMQQLIKHEFLRNSQKSYFNVEVYDAVEKLFH